MKNMLPVLIWEFKKKISAFFAAHVVGRRRLRDEGFDGVGDWLV